MPPTTRMFLDGPLRPAMTALLLVACAGPAAGPDEADLAEPGNTAFSTTSTPITPALGSDPFESQRVLNRAIVRAHAGEDCMSGVPTNWSASRLFPGTKPALHRFCVYEWTGSADPKASDLPTLLTADIVHDRMAVVGLSTPVAPLADLEDNTLDLVDPVPRYASGLPSTRTRLVLLDTVPTSVDPLDEDVFDDHGSRLAALADRFVCDSRTSRRCAASVQTQLALGWEELNQDPSDPEWQAPADGGSVGRISDVATAIVDAVDTWEDDRDEDASVGNLVINLSLGWHPEAYEGTSASVAEQAVQAALQYASCRDALVVVAAGHDDTPLGEDGRTGASLPGAWEIHSEPTDSQCTSKFGGVSRASRSTSYRPLVHTVGAVTTELTPSGMGRPESVPPLVAPGEYLTVTPPGESAANDPISGTSVATVVASSAAAVAWTLSPSDSPHDVIGRVYTSGVEPDPSKTRRARVYHGSTAPKVRVANVCASAAAACAGSCSTVLTDSCPSAGAVAPVSTSEASSSSYVEILDSGLTANSDSCDPSWAYKYHHTTGGDYASPEHNCPIQQNTSASSIGAVLPMPDGDICDYCLGRLMVDPPSLDIHLKAGRTFDEFQSMSVAVHFAGEGAPDLYPLGVLEGTYDTATTAHLLLPFGAGERITASGAPVPATAMTLQYDEGNFSHSEPMYME